MDLGKVGLVGRFKPLHKGGQIMLEHVCAQADEVIIAVGSANKYNLRNPFTSEESVEMIDQTLCDQFDNYKIITLDDYAHTDVGRSGKLWRADLIDQMGSLDHFVTGNAYVANLLETKYAVVHPTSIIPREHWLKLRATEVRSTMAQGDDWQSLVPDPVAEYIQNKGLDKRFRTEFGAEALSLSSDYKSPETLEEERAHTYEV